MGQVKEITIKNQTYFYDDMIDILIKNIKLIKNR